jgi:Protein of unknown function (DUF2800)
MNEHALLSASGAHRWMACPGSIRLSEGIADRTSAYAEEGTAAHEIAARCLRARRRDAAAIADDPGLASAVEIYLDAVLGSIERGDRLLVEQRVDLGPLNPPIEMFGTCDALVIKPKRRQLHVFDLKFGAGVPVEIERNPQTRYYALAGLLAAGCGIDTIEIVIVQPRLTHPAGPVRREILLALELTLWGRELLAAAHRALAPEAPLAPGSWCRFCPAQGACPALRERTLASAQNDFTAVQERN